MSGRDIVYQHWFKVALLLVAGALTLWSARRLYDSFGAPAYGDFKRMWAAAAVFRSGGDPYDNRALSSFSVAHGAGETIDLPLYLPPVAFPYLLPLAIDSFQMARYCYLGGVILFVFVVWVVPYVRQLRAEDSLRGVAALAALTTFFPLLLMWWVGPLSAWPLVGIVLCGTLIHRDRFLNRFASGFGVMLVLVKPHCAPLVLPFVLGFCLATRRSVEILGILVGLGFGVWGAIALTSEISFFERIGETTVWMTPAPLRALGWPLSPRATQFLPVFLGGVWAFFSGLRTRELESFSRRLSLIIVPLGFALTPFVWTYDFTPLLVTISGICAVVFNRNGESASPGLWAIGAVILLNTLLTFAPLAMELHWWYPLGFLLIGALLSRNESRISGSGGFSPT